MTILTRIASGLLFLDHHKAAITYRLLSGAARLNNLHAEALASKAGRKVASGEAKARRLAESRKEQAHRALASQLRTIQEDLQTDLAKVYIERDRAAQTVASYEAVGYHCHTSACIRDERAAVLKGIRDELRSNV